MRMFRFSGVLKCSFKMLTMILLAVSLILTTSITVSATSVDLDGIWLCQEGGRTDQGLISTNKDNELGVSGGVIFNLPEHDDVTICLTTSKGLAWVTSLGRTAIRKPAKAKYHVAFYDADWNNVWQKENAIKNGKPQDFVVGSNVRHIQVWSSWSYNVSTGYINGILTEPYVGWDGVVN